MQLTVTSSPGSLLPGQQHSFTLSDHTKVLSPSASSPPTHTRLPSLLRAIPLAQPVIRHGPSLPILLCFFCCSVLIEPVRIADGSTKVGCLLWNLPSICFVLMCPPDFAPFSLPLRLSVPQHSFVSPQPVGQCLCNVSDPLPSYLTSYYLTQMMTQFSYILHAADFVCKWGMCAPAAMSKTENTH